MNDGPLDVPAEPHDASVPHGARGPDSACTRQPQVDPGSGSAPADFAALYEELRVIAGRLFRGQAAGHTLQPTAILHEAFLKLAQPCADTPSAGGASTGRAVAWRDRDHFLNLAACAMRQVLVNHARDRSALKRGGGGEPWRRITLDPHLGAEVGHRELDLLALDDELARLAALDERQARIVELRVFGGLTQPEIARVLGVSLRTVELDWKMARGYLATRLQPDEEATS